MPRILRAARWKKRVTFLGCRCMYKYCHKLNLSTSHLKIHVSNKIGMQLTLYIDIHSLKKIQIAMYITKRAKSCHTILSRTTNTYLQTYKVLVHMLYVRQTIQEMKPPSPLFLLLVHTCIKLKYVVSVRKCETTRARSTLSVPAYTCMNYPYVHMW